MRGLPIPIIFLRDRRTDPNQIEPIREVVDGQQRLRTVLGYVSPTLLPDYNPQRDFFTVKRTHNEDIAGKSFDELDDESKRAIPDYEFAVHILPSRVDDREVIQIFRRMNSTTPHQVSQIKLASERIKMRTVPEPVLDASDRRTTNPKERNELFNYLLQLVKADAETNK